MENAVKPTCEELWEGYGFEEIETNVMGTWRHGVMREDIFLRESDQTYWLADYRVSTDGETNELREGGADIYKVIPATKTVKFFEKA